MSKKKENEAEAASSILEYLNTQNRPYSAGDIFSNLHGKFGKTIVVKACESLASSGKINEKIYGKQKVYAPKQTQYADYKESDLQQIDEEIKKYEKICTELQRSCKVLEEEYRVLKSSLTTEEAIARLSELNKICQNNQDHLKRIKSESNHISPAEKDKIIKNRKTAVQTWKKRKRIEDVGIETDEEYNVTVPQI
ncbi:homologous-pairing protein 2 homolog isoform X3 [Xenia sp. Carnegie-2017]|uniref:homologous-pairing protein 2 homolog isoform X3 n=1 Tax=Xenia sp. Carnegie-2017 TaxID=2897299 RepID=UPI001F041947|nr:homologous-pairing protein 2 homolog isoform X3 [Xenia sp. Carnegie-2017]